MSKIKKYGLIGKSLKHSFSPKYFAAKFKHKQIKNSTYDIFELNEISAFKNLTLDVDFAGLNVTIPYKQAVIPFLDELNEVAKELQAVNCIQFIDGKLIGHNTDVFGFEKSIVPLLKPQHTQALILGTGGAAQAVAFVLKKLGIHYQFVSTKKSSSYLNYSEASLVLADFPLIINTTPVGMFPKENESPFEALKDVGAEHLVYDLIYNPAETKLLKLAKQQGAQIKNGQEMLEIQAEESWLIWN